MALGNNLKRAKKDSLIPPTKKAEKGGKKAKSIDKVSVKAKKIIETKPAKVKEQPSAAIQPSKTAHFEEKVLLGGNPESPITAKLFPSRRKSVRKTKLVLNGSLTLAEAEPFYDCLLTTFNEYDLIDIKLEEISQLDLIPIQMINVFINQHPDKTIKVDSDLPFDIKLIVERAGFGSLMFKEEVA